MTYVGMDVHKKAIHVAMLPAGSRTAVHWQLVNEPRAIKRLVRRLKREAPGELRCCYEAGPCGFALQRRLQQMGIPCELIAPTLIPKKPGDRVKTDRRDAMKLAELYRAGMLTEVCPPTEAQEAVRDFCRCREDLQQDLTRARNRLGKFLLRRGQIYSESKTAWTEKHREWLRGLRFEQPADRLSFEDYLLGLEQLEERLKRLDEQLEAVAEQQPYRQPVGYLRCFRGIDTQTALTVVAELHRPERFQSARQLMSYVGLVPSEYSSSEDQRRGSITKAGNRHLRRVLVETAWHYRHRPALGRALRKRREGQPAWVLAIADKAQVRLSRRFWRLTEKGRPRNKAVVAVARELLGFLWDVLSRAARQSA